MANFRIAEQFVSHLRLHRGRAAFVHKDLAQTFRCSENTLQSNIGLLMQAKIINRSSERGRNGFEYWFANNAMLTPQWLDVLHLELNMAATKSRKFNVGQKFGIIHNLMREVKSGVEEELSMLKQTINTRDFRIKELEEENSSMRFEMNRMLVRMQELEAAHNSLVAMANSREQKAAEAKAAESSE